jgi:hypothetical protein
LHFNANSLFWWFVDFGDFEDIWRTLLNRLVPSNYTTPKQEPRRDETSQISQGAGTLRPRRLLWCIDREGKTTTAHEQPMFIFA